jgi:predicted alpha-1,2-mannosidase
MILKFSRTFFFVALIALSSTAVSAQKSSKAKEIVDYVNPLIGSPFAGFAADLQGGGTTPLVGRPFAMTNFMLQTHENKMSRMPYIYEDTTVIGFIATHQPTVWMGDYGYVSVMPEVGALKLLPKERTVYFDHKTEISKPYYYSVDLKLPNHQKLKGEIAGASRCGMFRFTFPKSDESHILVQGINLNPELNDANNDLTHRIATLKGFVHVDVKNGEITGYNPDRQSAQLGPELPNFKGYFIIQFDKSIDSYGTWNQNDAQAGGTDVYGTRIGAYISFKTKKNEVITLRIATSFVSLDQARENLLREIPDGNFDHLVKSTKDIWQKNLSCMEVQGVTEDQKAIFYTALFHTMLFPREFSEYGKYYSAFDDTIHEGVAYNDYSLWDTYRAQHPLLIFTQTARVNDMITSLLQMYKQGGWLPMWPNPTETNIMLGSHADAVIADAYIKGFRGFDTALAYEAVRKDGLVPPDNDTHRKWGDRELWQAAEARGGLSYYHSIGYVPVDKVLESVSRTIEFSMDDYCVAQMAKAQGKMSDYKRMMEWSKNYENVYNKDVKFFAPRNFDGSWLDASHENDGFTEGDKWTYAFGVMHDMPGMISLMGGNEAFATMLDSNFSGGHYHHDNEPGHHYVYLYDYCGQPWKTQELVRKHTSINYLNKPLGLNGNDDCGQMSAWYLFGVMGFYPVTPASGIYAIGAPQFPHVVMNYMNNGKAAQLEIDAVNLSEANMYVQKVTLDGRSIDHPFISHQEILNGQRLVFEMGSKPNTNWK